MWCNNILVSILAGAFEELYNPKATVKIGLESDYKADWKPHSLCTTTRDGQCGHYPCSFSSLLFDHKTSFFHLSIFDC